jgi:hypothetical protein
MILKGATFRKLNLFLSSVEGMETPSMLDPTEWTDLNPWTYTYQANTGCTNII